VTPFCVGLTGGLASGKTSAAKRFEELGATVVDTDAISHELTQAGTTAMTKIQQAFGSGYQLPNGSLDRAKMRQLVFGDPAARAKLEAILHPLIRDRARALIAAAQQPYVVVVVPLLLETGAYRDLIQRVLVIDCREDEQVARAMQRSGLKEDEVRAILAAQLSRAERLKRADDVIDNSGGIDELHRQVDAAHVRFLELSRATASKRDASHGSSDNAR